MRWLSLAVLAVAVSSASAKPVARDAPAPDRDRGDFWRDVIEPHGEEVRTILTKATQTIQAADNASNGDVEWAVDQRTHLFADAYGMLRYARKLSPANVEVLALLARAADELGKTDQALEALQACIAEVGPERAGPNVTGRLGMIYLRLGDGDAAIRWLRYTQGGLSASSAPALVHLANALAVRGQIAAAVDTLATAMPAPVQYFSDEVVLAMFGLAAIYDRDEQRGAAFDTLDKLQSGLQQEYGARVQHVLGTMRFAPAEDQHYYQALLYESLGAYTEARAEWLLYAQTPDLPWRARALEHVAAIDALRRAPATIAPPVVPPPPPVVPHRLRRTNP